MYPDKTCTRKISISILRYSPLYTRPALYCSIYSVNPPLPSPLPQFDGPTRNVLFILPSVQAFSWNWIISFLLNFGMVLETQMKWSLTKPYFFRKTSFVSNNGTMCQNLAQNTIFWGLLKKLVFNFHWICSMMQNYIICCVYNSMFNLFIIYNLYLAEI